LRQRRETEIKDEYVSEQKKNGGRDEGEHAAASVISEQEWRPNMRVERRVSGKKRNQNLKAKSKIGRTGHDGWKKEENSGMDNQSPTRKRSKRK
jgi:hypothetical protein